MSHLPTRLTNLHAAHHPVPQSYKTYIRKVLKQVHPEREISRKAMSVMNSFVGDNFDTIANEAGTLANESSRKTLRARDIQTAVRLTYPGEISKHAVSEGIKAVANFTRDS